VVIGFACSGSPAPAAAPTPTASPRSDVQKALEELESLTKQMCACQDPDCADRVFLVESADRQRLHDALDAGDPDEDDIKKMLRLENEMTACMNKGSGKDPEPATPAR
jgi:hypothetical protein